MKNFLILLSVWAAAVTAAAQTLLSPAEMSELCKPKAHASVRVHDPSVVYDSRINTHYIIGSHLYTGISTNNMQDWRQSGMTLGKMQNGKVVVCDAEEAFSTSQVKEVTRTLNGMTETIAVGNYDAKAWKNAYGESLDHNMWAPDIIWNESLKKWCFYLSLNGNSYNSVIVLMTGDSPTGPFVYQGPVVYSGFKNATNPKISWKKTDLEVVLGTQSTLPARYNHDNDWQNFWLNSIDPCVFYDEEGELWMAYGSWFGGIYMLRLDKNTGLRDYTYTYESDYDTRGQGCLSDAYFGKKIAGGYYVSGEAPYIKHMGDKYYLFVTYGELRANGGYDIRVFSSDKPDGPYTDLSGKKAIYSRYAKNFAGDATEDRGSKLLSDYNGWGMMTVGERSGGHCSVTIDPKGRALMVYHTRFNNGTEEYEVRTRQLFLNSKGGVCAAPFEFDNETTTQKDIEGSCVWGNASLAGTYHYIKHPYRQNCAIFEEATPASVTLKANGTVSGKASGSWVHEKGTSFVSLTLDGEVYDGVFVEQTIDQTNMKALAFTGVSKNGVPVWLYRMSDKCSVAYNYSNVALPVRDGQAVDHSISLGSSLQENASIEWTSSNPEVLAADGTYTKPAEDTEVTLTANIVCGDYCAKKSVKVMVKSEEKDASVVGSTDCTSAYNTEFSDSYQLEKGQAYHFVFTNHNKGNGNAWDNWMLVCNNAADAKELFRLRADSYAFTNDVGAYNNGQFNTNLPDYVASLNGATYDMVVSYSSTGTFNMTSKVTLANGSTYSYNYAGNQNALTANKIDLFFTVEKSYIEIKSAERILETVGNSSFTSGWWEAFSRGYQIANGEEMHFEFDNYSDMLENWHNWVLIGANSDSRDANGGYKEYFALRADHYGWGDYYDENTLVSEYDWDTFKQDMNGSHVDMNVGFANGKVTVNCTITTANGKVLPYHFESKGGIPGSAVTVFFTVEKASITLTKAEQVKKDTGDGDNDEPGSDPSDNPGDDPSDDPSDNPDDNPSDNPGTEPEPTPEPEIVGNTDYSTAWWEAFSSSYQIAEGRTMHFEFDNYSDGLENWHNWILIAANGDSRDPDFGYSEYFALRPDHYGWGTYFDESSLVSAYDWDTFKQDMKGAHVVMDVTYAEGKVKVNCSTTTANGTILPYHFESKGGIREAQITLFFTVENAYIRITKAELVKEDSGKEPEDNPGEEPGDDPSDNPGSDPSDNPGDNPTDNPGNDPSDNPGDDPGTEPEPTPEPEIVGNTDYSTGWWEAFSSSYQIAEGKTMHFEFDNYGDGLENWHNWILIAANGDSRDPDFGYSEYFALRPDHYGWGTYYDESSLVSAYDWDTFKQDMKGAHVVMDVTYADGRITVNSTTTTANGVILPYYFQSKAGINEPQITVFFTVENAYVKITKAELVKGDSDKDPDDNPDPGKEPDSDPDDDPIEVGIDANSSAIASHAARYNLSGQKVGEHYKGIIIVNGVKRIVK